MTTQAPDFPYLLGYELFTLDCTLPRLAVAGLFGIPEENLGGQDAEVMSHVDLYLIDYAMMEANFMSYPSSVSCFPPLISIELKVNENTGEFKYSIWFKFDVGHLALFSTTSISTRVAIRCLTCEESE